MYSKNTRNRCTRVHTPPALKESMSSEINHMYNHTLTSKQSYRINKRTERKVQKKKIIQEKLYGCAVLFFRNW